VAGLQAIVAFTETARQGGFAGAARELGLSPSAVAKSVARLEQDLGLRLFHRSTRQVSLTSEGIALYDRCRRIVDEIEGLRDEAAGARSEPSGKLRIDVPITLGRRVLVPALARLAQRHPKLALEVALSDRYADLVKEGLDAVVRIGVPDDSSLVARRIGTQRMVFCASPAYLAAHGTPQSVEALREHACLLFRMPSSGRIRPWTFRLGRRALEVVPESRVVMNDGEALVAAAVAGAGICNVPDYMAAEALRTGQLVEVLASFRPPSLPISLVYVSRRRVTPRLRALTDVLGEADVAAQLGGLDDASGEGARRPRRRRRG
jgi:DNA-binding transcriptional LysR family regulator